ncbi:HPF/RaiA family ribosome-associated protein [soil metagenome]
MQVKTNTDHNIPHSEALNDHVETVVKDALSHFSDQITRVEVHINDELGKKPGDSDKRCMMEARLTGHQPVAVSDHAATVHQAIQGASEKLKRAIDHTLGRLADKPKGRKSLPEVESDVSE